MVTAHPNFCADLSVIPDLLLIMKESFVKLTSHEVCTAYNFVKGWTKSSHKSLVYLCTPSMRLSIQITHNMRMVSEWANKRITLRLQKSFLLVISTAKSQLWWEHSLQTISYCKGRNTLSRKLRVRMAWKLSWARVMIPGLFFLISNSPQFLDIATYFLSFKNIKWLNFLCYSSFERDKKIYFLR